MSLDASDSNDTAQFDWRRHNIGRLLVSASKLFESRILHDINSNGFPQITLAHLAVPRSLDLEGTRITEMARREGVTKQAMAKLVHSLQTMKVVKLSDDPDDGRAKFVLFTNRGLKLLAEIRKSISQREAELSGIIGEASLERMKTDLMIFTEKSNNAKPNNNKPGKRKYTNPKPS